MFVAAWCLLGLVLTSCYTCKLTSLLVGVTSPPPFTSLAEMVAQDDIRWGLVGGAKTFMSLRVGGQIDRLLFFNAQSTAKVIS